MGKEKLASEAPASAALRSTASGMSQRSVSYLQSKTKRHPDTPLSSPLTATVQEAHIARRAVQSFQRALKRILHPFKSLSMASDIIQLMLYIFRPRYSRIALIFNIMNIYPFHTFSLSQIAWMLSGSNQVGKLLRISQHMQAQAYINTISKTRLIRYLNLYQLIMAKMLSQSPSLQINRQILKQSNSFTLKLTIFLKQYSSYKIYKEGYKLIQCQCFNKAQIDSFCAKPQKLTFRNKVIAKFYQQYIQQHNSQDIVYAAYQVIQYLLILSTEQFKAEFNAQDDQTIDQLVNLLSEAYIYTLTELAFKVTISKHVEFSQLIIKFSNSFKIEHLTDNIIVNMLDGIENRLLKVEGFQFFLIIRRISDNKIIKSLIDHQNKNKACIEYLMKQCANNNVHNIILVSNYTYDNLDKLRIRYLNYINNNIFSQPISIILLKPENLICASLYNVKIINFNQCINLKNLYSMKNTYILQDFILSASIKRFYSFYDKYESHRNCLLFDLFQYNTLEYVFIYNGEPNSNILNSITLDRNISKLRYVDIYQKCAKYDIKLDISNNVPQLLSIFTVYSNGKQNDRDSDDVLYGTIQGDSATIQNLEKKFIYKLPSRQ